ncbi:Mitochondrial metal transporter 2 [Lecanosticta acicola]|uniref:Mitochondrial metal transporter 2 n=1 Tax=Lecanosticta acicola TaxID=111012 RepID=A0AAI8Z2W5_9PEZI|nr:Mitochondrial metal transporter 2 [Lecanosticta acicola]
MPRESRNPMASHAVAVAPYPTTSASASGQRNAAIWSSADDEILLQARASGLNWQPIANRHFPNKSANACRKRHERLIERRHVDDWDTHKLELLAQEYMACRKEMWETLAARLGEKWGVVEAKCMEKGLKTLQTAARTAQRKATADYNQTLSERGISDNNSDSGVGFCSDAELEAGEAETTRKASSWRAHTSEQQPPQYPEHVRSRSLPQPLPLYQPPPPIRRTFDGSSMMTSPQDMSFSGQPASQRCSPDSQNSRISIQSIVSN